MIPSIEELLRKVQGTQIGQRDELEDAWVNSGYVFSQPNGTAIDPDLITKAFKKMVMELGMPHLTPHDLRHQSATAAREAGVQGSKWVSYPRIWAMRVLLSLKISMPM